MKSKRIKIQIIIKIINWNLKQEQAKRRTAARSGDKSGIPRPRSELLQSRGHLASTIHKTAAIQAELADVPSIWRYIQSPQVL